MAEAAVAAQGEGGAPASNFWPKVITVAWMSIFLGVGIELLLLAALALTAKVPGAGAVVADSAQKISWAVFVCVGLALGNAALKARPAVMGILGLITAPLGFALARSVHKGALQALGLAGVLGGGGFPLMIALLKGLEYGALGLVVGWLGRRGHGLGAYAGAGAAAGLSFGTVIVVLLTQTAPAAGVAAIVPRAVNEIFFPMGCALVLYAAEALTKRG